MLTHIKTRQYEDNYDRWESITQKCKLAKRTSGRVYHYGTIWNRDQETSFSRSNTSATIPLINQISKSVWVSPLGSTIPTSQTTLVLENIHSIHLNESQIGHVIGASNTIIRKQLPPYTSRWKRRSGRPLIPALYDGLENLSLYSFIAIPTSHSACPMRGRV